MNRYWAKTINSAGFQRFEVSQLLNQLLLSNFKVHKITSTSCNFGFPPQCVAVAGPHTHTHTHKWWWDEASWITEAFYQICSLEGKASQGFICSTKPSTGKKSIKQAIQLQWHYRFEVYTFWIELSKTTVHDTSKYVMCLY